MSYNFTQFIEQHRNQLVSSDIPEYFWYSLFFKLNEEIYDIGNVCELKLNQNESKVDCVIKKSIIASGGENIFIIDNAWSFTMNNAKSQLKEMGTFRERVATMVGIDTDDAAEDDIIDCVLDTLWSYVRYYDIKTNEVEESTRVWYLLDEVGTYIQHSVCSPTVRIVPFMYIPNGVCYSIAWFIKDVDIGDKLTVDRLEHITDLRLKQCLSYVWTKKCPKLTEDCETVSKTMTPEFFISHRAAETDPDLTIDNLGQLDKTKGTISVYTDVSFVQNSLKLNPTQFTLTDVKSEADILWLFDHFKDFETLSREQPRTLINQFPSETVMTTKDLLAALGSNSDWIPKTFNLKTELAEFINFFHKEQQENKNNQIEDYQKRPRDCPCNCHRIGVNCDVCEIDMTCGSVKADVAPVWIVKPWNLSRGLGIFVTQNIEQILRMVEAYPAEPKITSRYIIDPVLFYREELDVNVKFDIRYMVMLNSVEPLKAYVGKVFWLRFANKQFVLRNWDDYETHFTVMNYKENCQLKNINCTDFIELFELQYKGYKWSKIEKEIHRGLKKMLEDVTSRPDPLRVKHSPQSRGMYAVDLMLEWNRDVVDEDGLVAMRPKVCEVNFCPDCTRAVQYHPDFFSDVFKTMFLDQPTNAVELCPGSVDM